MRRLPKRPELSAEAESRLEQATAEIIRSADQKSSADRLYQNARSRKWFKNSVEKSLRTMSGPGARCMYCSGSEASQVEHFVPKSIVPQYAMTWENFLWAYGICNNFKGNRFPPFTEAGEEIIDPTAEDVWKFFFIDEYGNLTARWRQDLNDLDPRAVNTIKILKLDRDALQQTRQQRLGDLKSRIEDGLKLLESGRITAIELRNRRDNWLTSAFQPDLADYFLAGPGRKEPPFADFLKLVRR